jgi:uncharacterized lipoprotein NlpE involved in copper resistance
MENVKMKRKITLMIMLILSLMTMIGCSASAELVSFIDQFKSSTNHQMVLSMYSTENGFMTMSYQVDGNKTFTGNSLDPTNDTFTYYDNGTTYIYTQDEDSGTWVKESVTDEVDSVFDIASEMVAADFQRTGNDEFTLKSSYLNDYEMESFVIVLNDDGAVFTIVADGIEMTIIISEFNNISLTLPALTE